MAKIPPGKPPSQRNGVNGLRPDDDLPQGNLWAHLRDHPETRQMIVDAGVVIGVDPNSGSQSIFFGRATLKRIVKSGQSKAMTVVEVPVDFETDDAEALYVFCLKQKGSCCYNADDLNPERIDTTFN